MIRRYDILLTNNNGLNVALRINYFNAELNGLDENLLILCKSPDRFNWIAQGFSTRNSTDNFVEKTGIADFSRRTLSTTTNTLPVVPISFTVQCNNGNAILFWKTAQEQNSKRLCQKSRITKRKQYPSNGPGKIICGVYTMNIYLGNRAERMSRLLIKNCAITIEEQYQSFTN